MEKKRFYKKIHVGCTCQHCDTYQVCGEQFDFVSTNNKEILDQIDSALFTSKKTILFDENNKVLLTDNREEFEKFDIEFHESLPVGANIPNIKAVLSTTILPLDGTYRVETIENVNIEGIPHYVGHPSTKAIIENLGGVEAPSKLFKGLNRGEKAVCFSIKQGHSSRKDIGKTVDQDVNMEHLCIRLITRLD